MSDKPTETRSNATICGQLLRIEKYGGSPTTEFVNETVRRMRMDAAEITRLKSELHDARAAKSVTHDALDKITRSFPVVNP